eukprot:1040593-Rhodomonas_salina.1
MTRTPRVVLGLYVCLPAISALLTQPLPPSLSASASSSFPLSLPLPRVPAQRRSLLSLSLRASVEGQRKKVLVVGGTGRVGGSTARFILEFGDEEGIKTDVVLAGRSAEKYSRSRNRILSRQGSGGEGEDWTDRIMFAEVNYEDEVQLKQAVAESDLVIHTAGPFQQKENPLVLDAAIAAGVPYVDV